MTAVSLAATTSPTSRVTDRRIVSRGVQHECSEFVSIL